MKWPTKQTFFSGKIKWLVCAVIAVLVLIVAGVFIIPRFAKDEPAQKMVDQNCSGEIAIAAAAAIKAPPTEQAAALTTIVDRIKQVPNYNQDPNCLYPIIKQHLTKGENAQAKELHKQFESVYEKGFSGAYGVSKKAVSQEVDSTDTLKKNAQDSAIYIFPQKPKKGASE